MVDESARPRRARLRSAMALALMTVSALALIAPASAQSASTRDEAQTDFNIPAQALGSALLAFAEQSGTQILFNQDDVAGFTSRPLSGRFPPDAALAQLLPPGAPHIEIAGDRVIRVAPSNPQGAQLGAVVGGDELVVTGTRIRGAAPAGANLLSLDRDDIDATGRATVQDVLATLPQNFPGSQGELTQLSALDGRRNIGFGSTVDLRGLGADATLTLVNGRRLAPSGYGNFVDISTIPLSAIDRIEVLADGASATYGSDAVGGVVNIILDRGFDGAATMLRQGGDGRGGLGDFGASQLFGANWRGGNAMIGYEYRERDHLAAADRAFTSSSDLRSYGGGNFSRTLSNPGNITRIGASTVTLPVPRNQNGLGLSEADFVSGPLNEEELNEGAFLIPDQISHALVFSARQALGERVELYVDVLAGARSAYAEDTQVGATISVPESNYYRQTNNLFLGRGPLTMSYAFGDDLGPIRHITEARGGNGAFGVLIDLTHNWDLELGAAYARQREDVRIENTFENSASVIAALASNDPATAFNPFADGSNTPASVLAGFTFDQTLNNDSILTSYTLKADGPLLAVWGGWARGAFGIERRQESFDISRTLIRTSGITHPFLQAPGERVTDALFAELLLPLVSSAQNLPLVDLLTVSASVRHEEADQFEATTPKLGVTWEISPDLALRATWGRSFKAPQFQQLLGSTAGSLISATPAQDPFATGGSTGLLVLAGSNPNLRPEEAETWTAGFSYRPHVLDGLSVDATYFDIDFTNRITTPGSFLTALRDPTGLESVFTRNPTLTEVLAAAASVDVVAGSLPLSAVEVLYDSRLTNLASLRVRGIDLSIAYAFQTDVGNFAIFASASGLLQYERFATPSAPGIEQLDTLFNPVDWRGRFGVTWSNSSVSAAISGAYVDAYTDTLSTPARRIDASLFWDARVSYRWTGDAGRGPTLSLNVQNILDDDPPFANNPIGYGFDSSNASPLGRVFSLQLQQRW